MASAESVDFADRIEAELRAWPSAALDEVVALSRLVRTASDAGSVVRMAYTGVFMAVPQVQWAVWDQLSRVLPRAWDTPELGLEMIGLAKLLGKHVAELSGKVNDLSPARLGRFAMGLLMSGVLAFAVARRASELAEMHRAQTCNRT